MEWGFLKGTLKQDQVLDACDKKRTSSQMIAASQQNDQMENIVNPSQLYSQSQAQSGVIKMKRDEKQKRK